MRTPLRLIPVFALLCPTALSLPAQTPPAPDPLTAQLQAIASAHHGSVALFAENLRTHQTVSLHPDLPVQTASVIKLAILYEALEQVRAGKAHFDDPITLTQADQVPGSGVLLFFDAPLHLTLKDVLTMMVVMSDNSATNLVIDHLGLANIDARIVALGLHDTWLYKKVFTPAPSSVTLPPDFKRFGLGKTTPREMSSIMARLATCDLATPEAPARPTDPALCEVALHMLHLQFYRTSIPRFLDTLPGATATSIASKAGALDAVRNDIAAISTPSGLIVLSAFTFSNRDHTWSADQEAELTLASLARAIVQAWSPEGLSPWPVPPLPSPSPTGDIH